MPVEMTRGPDASDFLLLVASEVLGLGDVLGLGLLEALEDLDESDESDESGDAGEGDEPEELAGVDVEAVGLEVDGCAGVGETATRDPAVAMVFVDDVVLSEAQAAVDAMARAAVPAATAVQRRLPGASKLLREGRLLREGVREGLAECWPKGNHGS
ncbi:hypothetical protein [Nonomuraea soli]|uniref:Uncharacterized protein n=1 Tax=Nonomuraea soli TaxID=1032476 RepID=A0A7W0CT44_9ACTN|nr:hypothetical protein [Nonomuraea soli]MBA2896848.1 hypothetical protein [Nonomuraea soli]